MWQNRANRGNYWDLYNAQILQEAGYLPFPINIILFFRGNAALATILPYAGVGISKDCTVRAPRSERSLTAGVDNYDNFTTWDFNSVEVTRLHFNVYMHLHSELLPAIQMLYMTEITFLSLHTYIGSTLSSGYNKLLIWPL